jgi:hypothetical protein
LIEIYVGSLIVKAYKGKYTIILTTYISINHILEKKLKTGSRTFCDVVNCI